jgi:Leucine-rich repeat (LRR) protein
MKYCKLLIFFAVFVICGKLFSQSVYSPADSAALVTIDKKCDTSDSLNWDREADPGKWTGVWWNDSTPKKVKFLGLFRKKLLDTLNVSTLNDLEALYVMENQLSGLNLTGLANLKNLNCDYNQLATLDINGLTNLRELTCAYNQLTNLDVTNLKNLTQLGCNNNKLISLKVTNLDSLKSLSCSLNNLSGLDLSGLPNLQQLGCSNNQFTNLDISGLKNLKSLNCYANLITHLDARDHKYLTNLYCSNSKLESLEISNDTSLTNIDCSFNNLTGLDISGLNNLSLLRCNNNLLTSINIAGLTKLKNLWVQSNQINSLILNDLDSLTMLNCSWNHLSTLDLSGLTKLTSLSCTHDKLPFSSLATAGPNVSYFEYYPQDTIFSPQILSGTVTINYSAEALIDSMATKFVFYKNKSQVGTNATGLYTTTGPGTYHCVMTNYRFPLLYLITAKTTIYARYNPADSAALVAIDRNCDTSDGLNWDREADPGKWVGVTWNDSNPKRVSKLIIEEKKLQGVMDVSPLISLYYLSCDYNQLTGLEVSGLTNLQTLYSSYNQLTSLDASGLTSLQILYCYSNQLTGLDASGLTNLQYLNCESNQLTNLQVSGLPNLLHLYCGSNQLTNLNVTGLPNLHYLSCYSNQLTGLDASGLTNLQYLYCLTNQMTNLDVSGLTNLKSLSCESNQLTNLNVSGLTNLVYLHCQSNQLTNLDVSGLTNLHELYCPYNKLTNLNLSGLTNLEILSCESNQLTGLNVSGLTNLQLLICQSNRLSCLDASGLTKLLTLYYNHNKLPFSSLAKGLKVKTYIYNPQDSIFTARSVAGNITIDYSAEALINGQPTNFVFYKNNVQVTDNTTGLYTTTGIGDYYCKMTNSLFPGLTLTTARISILQDLTVSPSAINMCTAPDTATFNIISNTDWNVVSSEAWLTINPASGLNNSTVTLTASANLGDTARTATVTISGTGVASQKVTITQAGFTPMLSASASALDIDASASSAAMFDIASNIVWNTVSSDTWLTLTPASGSNNGTVTLTAIDNPADTARKATITISGIGVASRTITVTQAAKKVTVVTDVSNTEAYIYPNPVNDRVYVRLAPLDLPATIGIYNMEGKQVMHMKTNTSLTEIEMEGYTPGVYIMRIMATSRIIDKKILKQ